MSTAWGPQTHAVALPPPASRSSSRFWIVILGGLALTLGALITSGFLASIDAPKAPQPCVDTSCFTLVHGQTETKANRVDDERSAAQAKVIEDFLGWAILLVGIVHAFPLVVGWRDARRGRAVAMTGCAVFFWPTGAAAYATGRAIGGAHRRVVLPTPAAAPSAEEVILSATDPLETAHRVASGAFGAPGGHVGWDLGTGNYITARPRGGMLVIGPPGSGKTSAVIIPSGVVAPGSVVTSSIKGDVMGATAHVRARRGSLWHFDPGGGEQTLPGVLQCRWSPLVSIQNWDDARRVASRMTEPARGNDAGGNGAHFTDRARDWLEVLLFAAYLDGRPIGDVADWAATAGSDDTAETVLTILILAADAGDHGARIARTQLEGLLTTPERERGSILSTMARLLRVYGSVTARELGAEPNFDPAQFVRSSDTLYVTASPERQHEYAPLIAGLLEEIRYAVYARHRAEEEHREPRRPHVTFVLDEANNTAPIPLPAIISEAGGQSLHVIVGIQDLSRARARWGREADGFLTLFPTKLVLPGVVEPYTLDALSNASGEYDRMTVSYSQSTNYVGQWSIPVPQSNPSYATHRQKVLHQGDIANLPPGTALLYEGAQWFLVRLGMHWEHPVWRYIDSHAAVLPLLNEKGTADRGGARV